MIKIIIIIATIVTIIVLSVYLFYRYKFIEKNMLIKSLHNTNLDYILENYDTNIKKTDYPSSYIYEIFVSNGFKNILNNTLKIQKYFGVNKTVYGIKKVNNEYFFEYYYYYPNENIKHNLLNILKFFKIKKNINLKNYYLVSFELKNNDVNKLEELNIYHTKNNCNHNSPINFHNDFIICKKCLECYNVTLNILSNKMVKKNTYKFFFRNSSSNEEIFNYTKSIIKKNIDLKKIFSDNLLSCKKSICITQKPNSYGFYFSLLPFDNFIKFMQDTNFNNEFSNKLINNKDKLSYLLFDIGFDIIIKEDNSILFTKLSFYGIL